MDRIIFGDNQFFGINHMCEEKAQAQAERFRDTGSIIDVVTEAYDCGIHAFMFNTHNRVAELCDYFRAHTERFPDLRLYPSLPYAHKYANAVNEKGVVGTLNDFVFSGQSVAQGFKTLVRGGKGILNQDMIHVMKLLVDAELRIFQGLNIGAIFLQNIVTDLLLGLKAKEVFIAFSDHIRNTYGVDPAFNTMNMPDLVDFLLECGIENPIVCSSINKAGYMTTPDLTAYEETLRNKHFRPMAMSILASGAIPPQEAIKYICSLPNIQTIVFGASSGPHIKQTREMILAEWDAVRLKPAV